MSRTLTVLLYVLLLAMPTAAQAQSSTYLFADNFALYPLGVFPSAGGWQLIYNGAGNSFQVVGDAPQQSGQALELVGSPCYDAAAFQALTLPNKFKCEADLLISGDLSGGCNHSDAQFGIYYPSFGGGYGVFFENDGQLHAWAGGTDVALMPYQENTWFHVACDCNLTNATIGVRINGGTTLAQLSITSAGATTGIYVDAGHGNNPTLWIDNVIVTVGQVIPIITWAKPSPILYGTPLGSGQLDATANVVGSFAYSPTNSTVLNVGTNALSVIFTPTDTNDYSSVTDSVSLVVSQPNIITIQKAVYLTSRNLSVGSNYQVQASSNLINWTNQGPVFTATNSNWQSTNYWNVNDWNQLFFQLQVVP